MKTLKYQLLAIIVIIATVNLTTISTANAQRRSTRDSKEEKKVEKKTKSRAEAVREKSTFKNYDSREQNQKKSSYRRDRSGNPVNKSAQRQVTSQKPQRSQDITRKSSKTDNRSRNTGNQVSRKGNRNSERNASTAYSGAGKSESRYNTSVRRSTGTPDRRPVNSVKTGINNSRIDNRSFYRHDNNDRRYTPNKNFHGNNKYWSGNNRPNSMNYNHANRNFYRKYDYRHYNHWDRSWENYRWNVRSWRDYYNGYNPYAYRYNRYYYHHPVYGDVIRKFVHRPNIFIHNHHRYYSFDGHFFRFVNGIGYVLVDLPFGLVFEQLPYAYDRVYINGYLYFRIGNLFFEYTNMGYQLVHYPERYYSYNDGYMNQGYYFDDIYY